MNASPVFRFKSALVNCCTVPLACGLYTSPRFSEVKPMPVNTLPIGLWNFVNINANYNNIPKIYSVAAPRSSLRSE